MGIHCLLYRSETLLDFEEKLKMIGSAKYDSSQLCDLGGSPSDAWDQVDLFVDHGIFLNLSCALPEEEFSCRMVEVR
jgi:hypothetical protein